MRCTLRVLLTHFCNTPSFSCKHTNQKHLLAVLHLSPTIVLSYFHKVMIHHRLPCFMLSLSFLIQKTITFQHRLYSFTYSVSKTDIKITTRRIPAFPCGHIHTLPHAHANTLTHHSMDEKLKQFTLGGFASTSGRIVHVHLWNTLLQISLLFLHSCFQHLSLRYFPSPLQKRVLPPSFSALWCSLSPLSLFLSCGQRVKSLSLSLSVVAFSLAESGLGTMGVWEGGCRRTTGV